MPKKTKEFNRNSLMLGFLKAYSTSKATILLINAAIMQIAKYNIKIMISICSEKPFSFGFIK